MNRLDEPQAREVSVLNEWNLLAVSSTSPAHMPEADEALDRLTRLSTRLLEVPIAAVSYVSGDRQLFRSTSGGPEALLRAGVVPLNPFCREVVERGGPVAVGDTSMHPLVCDDPWLRELEIAAYAGVPIRCAGRLLGTLCVVDRRPRRWSAEQIESLETIALGIMAELERRREVRERKALDDRLAFCLEGTRQGIWETDMVSGECFLWSTWLGLLGYEADEVEHHLREWEARIHPDDLPDVQAALQEYLAGPRPTYEAEYRMRTKAGEWMWFLSRGRIIEWTAEGAAKRMMGTITDITEKVNAQTALRASEGRLQRVVDTVTDAIVIVDMNGRITFANAATEHVLGFGPDIQGTSYDAPEWKITAIDGGPFPHAQLPFVQVTTTGEPVLGVEHAIEVGDRRRIISVNAAPLRTGEGALEGMIASIRDVTDARDAAEKIRFQATLLEAVGEAVVATDPEGVVVSWNRAAEALHQWSSQEAVGRNVREMTLPPESLRRSAEIVDMLRTGRSWRGELQLSRRDGTTFPAHLSCSPLLGPAGALAGMIGISHDLTERKQLEEQLRQSQKLEAIGRLAGGIAHDFNNLLMVIDVTTMLVLDDLPADSASRGDLEQVKQTVQRAASLTRQLLAFSRKQVLQLQPVDLNDVVNRTQEMLRRVIGEDVELLSSQASDLGCIEADPDQITQVLMNLAVNARDAMPTGGTLAVTTRNVKSPGWKGNDGQLIAPAAEFVLLSVEDTGCGMDAETVARIFEPFFTTKEVGRGTGLGLSTVYGIVKQSGGQINVESQPGSGTSFHIYLPRVRKYSLSSTESSSSPAVGSGQTILLVEDAAEVRSVISRVLTQAGYSVIEAENGASALALCETIARPIDLVVTDVVMPGMSGRALAERLRAARPGLKVLFMSGYTDDAVLRHGVSRASVDLLQKPFAPGRLLERVAAALGPALRVVA